ncbi:MAG: hypothetical protein J4215_00775 [Candidatus Diapherotrites archaeon]|uniref:Protein kinase domain-containing protein n=1 Tax=Candidatus Iainarchaeum sp. TaxID=3101447 RepID=A0A8T4LDW8_9ARCH|nr:hypothetical protein [Candidatus Diapherotrites archaeon]
MIGRVHQLGIAHGHPHGYNIIVSGSKVGLIDFRLATAADPSIWRDMKRIRLFFIHDHFKLMRIIRGVKPIFRTRIEQKAVTRQLFSSMIRQYPCSEKIKKELIDYCLENY